MLRVVVLGDPRIGRLPSVRSHKRSPVGVVAEHLNAKIREIEVDYIDTTLIPVKEPDSIVRSDPEVRRSGVSVHHRDVSPPQGGEHLEHLGREVIRQ